MKKKNKTKLNEFSVRRAYYSNLYEFYEGGMESKDADKLSNLAYSPVWQELMDFDPNYDKINWGSPKSVLKSLNKFFGYEKKH